MGTSEEGIVADLPWGSAINAANGHLMLPSRERCTVVGASSPRRADSVATPTGDVRALLPAEVVVEHVPPELRHLEVVLDDDLVLRMPAGRHDIEIVARSNGESRWLGVLGGRVEALKAIDTFVGGHSVETDNGPVLLASPTQVGSLTLDCVDNDGLMVGWIEADDVRVGGGLLHVVAFPMQPLAGIKCAQISSSAARIVVGSYLMAGSIGEGTRVACETDESLVTIGDRFTMLETKDLTIIGGRLRIAAGVVAGLTLRDVDVVEVGEESEPDPTEPTIDSSVRTAVAGQLGYGMATGVTGSVRELRVAHRGVVAGDRRHGFSAQRVAATPTSEISGLDARSFNLYSAGVLRGVRRLGLWVDPSTKKARRHFEAEVRKASEQPDPALFELAHRRKQLLALAVDTQQDGHTLSVLREAEKDARRASLPTTSRERVLLELWRWLLGYGERIGYPLLIGTVLIFWLGVGYVGWDQFWSEQWWRGWGVARVESVMNFALPGVGILGIDGIGGAWGISAKIVSVIFFASAVTAAVRVVKRGE